MTQETPSTSASTDSHPAPEQRSIKERVQALQQDLSELSKTLDEVHRNLRDAAGGTEK